MRYRTFNQVGDTIVEVMIAISVLAFALGSSYAVVNKSNQAILANKERHQAQLVASGQVELLRDYILSNTASARDTDGDLKHNGLQNTCIKLVNISGSETTRVFTQLPSDNNQCDFTDDASGAVYKVNTKQVKDACNTAYCDFKITVTWDSLRGTQEELITFYGS